MTRRRAKRDLAMWNRRLTRRYRRLKAIDKHHRLHARRLRKYQVAAANVRRLRKWLREHPPLRARALDEARKLVGVMEHGGNNTGKQVMKFIRANGGTGPEPWCGDFVAWCYRVAGSKVVQRGWASVRLIGRLSGMRVIKLEDAQPGDLVKFSFDHVGIFVRRVNGTTIETIEGNTGPTGAVSDSSTGGDGVYRKRRNASLVDEIVRVTR